MKKKLLKPMLHPGCRQGRAAIPIILLCAFLLLCASPTAQAATNVSGTISADTTWTLANSPYIVTGSITVLGATSAGATLTIQPGVQVRFNGAYSMTIGATSGNPGALIAQGTSANPIVFTSNQATPTAGYWNQIKFDNTSNDATTVLDYCLVEYGGSSTAAIYLNNASPTIRNTTVRYSKYAGFYMNNAAPTLSGNTVTANTTYGINISGGAPIIGSTAFSGNGNYDLYYAGTVGGTITGCTISKGIYIGTGINQGITGNTIAYNNSFPIHLGADGVGELLTANTITNADSQSFMEVTTGTIARDATWTAALKYNVLGSITVQGATSAGATLTIQPGAQVRFNGNYSMTIGGASGNSGALIAQGTSANPILFTSNQATPTAGYWNQIKFDNTSNDATTVLDYCLVEYGGSSTAALYLTNASPTIRNTTVRYSKYAGFYMNNAAPTLSGNTVTANTTYGINISGGAPIIGDTAFSGNGNYDLYYAGTVGGTITGCTISKGIYIGTGINQGITGNTIAYNNSFPIHLGANGMGELLTANTIANTDSQSFMEVTAGTIARDATWTAVLKFNVLGSITVQGATSAGATLTVQPGVQVRFGGNYLMTIGAASGNPGALIAQGTSANPIVFTSNQATPTAGYWNQIKFDNTSNDATTVLDYCLVEYGGSSVAALYLNNASPTIRNTTVRYSKYAGLYANGTGTGNASIQCNTFALNEKGINWTVTTPPAMHNNNFSNNTNYGLYYTGAAILNAENNWWGASTGPNTTGDKTYGNVDANPWSTAANNCAAPEPNQPPNIPSAPTPADNTVRVSCQNGVALSWTGGDPNATDILKYDLYWGTAADALDLAATALAQNSYTKTPVAQGATFYWKVVAKDDKGAQTAGPVWRFTSLGDPPDLIVTHLITNPAGHLESGQNVTLTAAISNAGTGPVVDPFAVDFKIAGASIGPQTVTGVILAGASVTVSKTWTCTGGNPSIEIIADSQAVVSETNEQNNRLIALLTEVADNTPPALISSSPAQGAVLKQLQQVSATLADSQSAVNDASVLASLTVTNALNVTMAGTKSEANDTFTFVPATLPIADGLYTVSLTAADTHGNTQSITFGFTIDTLPPVKPVITGGTVTSGIIRPRPIQNTTDQFIIQLTGTREASTSVWVNEVQVVAAGEAPWAAQITLQPGSNAFGIQSQDLAGNRSASEWVDIEVQAAGGVVYEYDAAGRVRCISESD